MDHLLESKLKNHHVLLKGDGLMQNIYHEWDVYKHTLKVVEHVKKKGADDTTIVAAYFHDIGKIIQHEPRLNSEREQEYGPNGEKYHIFDDPARHEEVGAGYLEKFVPEAFFEKLGVDKQEVVDLVRYHFTQQAHIQEMWEVEGLEDEKFEKMKKIYGAMVEDINTLSIGRDKFKERLHTLYYGDTMGKSEDRKHQENMIMFYEHLVEKKHTLRKIYDTQERMKKELKT